MARGALGESGLWSDDAIDWQMSHLERNNVRAAYIHTSGIYKNVDYWYSGGLIFFSTIEQYLLLLMVLVRNIIFNRMLNAGNFIIKKLTFLHLLESNDRYYDYM